MFDRSELDLLDEALRTLQAAMPMPQTALPDGDAFAAMRPVLLEAAQRLGTSAPCGHPLYLGHMLKPPHAAARIGYALALWLNPNNHAFDAGSASSHMEIEAVAQIARLFGWDDALGHLCSGGTVANLEALWMAREAVRETEREAALSGRQEVAAALFAEARAHGAHGAGPARPSAPGPTPLLAPTLAPNPAITSTLTSGIAAGIAAGIAPEIAPGIAASAQAHYCHARAASLLGLPFHAVAVDTRGRMDMRALQALLQRETIGTVVATLGTPAAGAVDPLHAIADLCAAHGARLHVDAAYGGYFTLAGNLHAEARRAFDAIARADSLVVDPHKHGLQPYGCGCLLLRDPALRRHYAHAPGYAYLATDEPHLGQVSLECSRPGAVAVALWATLRLLPLEPGGAFAQGLEAGRKAALRLWLALCRDSRFIAPLRPELDVVVWAVRAPSASQSSALARRLHASAQAMDLHLSLATLPRAMLEPLGGSLHWDAEQLLVLRACVMKPEHLDWMERILQRLDAAAREVLGPPQTVAGSNEAKTRTRSARAVAARPPAIDDARQGAPPWP